MSVAWKSLLQRYARGRQLCNCEAAYRPCRYGCSANSEFAKEELAERIVAELQSLDISINNNTRTKINSPLDFTQLERSIIKNRIIKLSDGISKQARLAADKLCHDGFLTLSKDQYTLTVLGEKVVLGDNSAWICE